MAIAYWILLIVWTFTIIPKPPAPPAWSWPSLTNLLMLALLVLIGCQVFPHPFR